MLLVYNNSISKKSTRQTRRDFFFIPAVLFLLFLFLSVSFCLSFGSLLSHSSVVCCRCLFVFRAVGRVLHSSPER